MCPIENTTQKFSDLNLSKVFEGQKSGKIRNQLDLVTREKNLRKAINKKQTSFNNPVNKTVYQNSQQICPLRESKFLSGDGEANNPTLNVKVK